MATNETEKPNGINAELFQRPLGELAEVLAQKVKREAPALLRAPNFVSADLHVLIRQAMRTYDLLFYLNADERRKEDCYWRPVYSIVALPLIRTMIDCLYNITMILQNPRKNGPWFRKSGYKRVLNELDEDRARYGGDPRWDEWIDRNRNGADFDLRRDGFSVPEVLAELNWPTLGRYLSRQPHGISTPHQQFLRSFTYGEWREYSAISHGGFEGLLRVGMYYIPDSMMLEDRPKMDEIHSIILSIHIPRAATLLLCIVTELQAAFRFKGARIDERVCEMWKVLIVAPEAEELHREHYHQLMRDARIEV